MKRMLLALAAALASNAAANAAEFSLSLDEFTSRMNAIRRELNYPPAEPIKDGETASRRNYSYQLSRLSIGITEEVKASSKLDVFTVGGGGTGTHDDMLDTLVQVMIVIRTIDPMVSASRGNQLVSEAVQGIARSGGHRIRIRGATAGCVNSPTFICVFRPDGARP